MSLRSTTTGQSVTLAAGGASAAGSGKFTGAVLINRTSLTTITPWILYEASGFSHRNVVIYQDDFWPDGGNTIDANLATDVWYWVVYTKPSGAAYARMHWASIAGSGAMVWNHRDVAGGTTLGDFQAANRVCVGDPFGVGFIGDVAVTATFADDLSDAEVEAIFTRQAGTLFEANPGMMAIFPEETAADPTEDVMGGSGEISRSTGWAPSADPATFDFSLSVAPPNAPPTANAGNDQTVFANAQVTLSGSGADTDGTVASYAWSQASGPSVTLAGSGATRTFTPTVSGTYIFVLTTTDDDGATSTPDTVTIIVIPEETSSDTGKKIGKRTVVVVRKAKKDRLDDTPSGTPPEHSISGCAVLPRTSHEEDRGWVIVEGRMIVAPYGSDVKATDQVRVDGVTWDVDGEPGNYESKRGKPKATIFYLKRLGS